MLFAVSLAGRVRATDTPPIPTVESLSHISPALPAIPDRTFNVKDFGAVGDGKTLDTDAIKKAIAKVESEGAENWFFPKACI